MTTQSHVMDTPDPQYMIRPQDDHDVSEIARLMGLSFAASHKSRVIHLLRGGEMVHELCHVAVDTHTSKGARLLGSIRYWPVTVGGRPALVLGPLAVNPEWRGFGIGVALVETSLALAAQGHWEWCFVSGEPNYYLKFGFKKVSSDEVSLPGFIEEERLHLMALPAAKPLDMPQKPWAIKSTIQSEKGAF